MPRTPSSRLLLSVTVALMAVVLVGAAVEAAPRRTKRVTVASSGSEVGARSYNSSPSADGRYVAFVSGSDALAAADVNGLEDVYVRDRRARRTTLISIDRKGGAADGASSDPAISKDGRFVAFDSSATDLVRGDTNESRDIFVRDRKRGRTRRVSVRTGGAQVSGDSFDASISGDGRFIVFVSHSDELIAHDGNDAPDIFVHDRRRRKTRRVSVRTGGAEADGGSLSPIISADGRFVVFDSFATNLYAGDDNDVRDVFIHDRRRRRTKRVSVGRGGGVADGESRDPEISADGRIVVFHSKAENLVPGDTNGVRDIFIRDRRRKRTRRVSIATGGGQATGGLSRDSAISADGRYVTFESKAADLVPGDTNGVADVFIHDRRRERTRRVSIRTDLGAGAGASVNVEMTADGRRVFFDSDSALVGRDANGKTDVYTRGPYR